MLRVPANDQNHLWFRTRMWVAVGWFRNPYNDLKNDSIKGSPSVERQPHFPAMLKRKILLAAPQTRTNRIDCVAMATRLNERRLLKAHD
eukprot:5019894-Amphidinium_carterae.1